MRKSPAFQFYPNDWLSSLHIQLMTPAEEGAYIRLLSYAWASEDCSLPDDDKILSQLSRLNEGWFNGASTKIRDCFKSKNGRLFNERLLLEKKKQEIWREKSRQGGIKSGKIRNNIELDAEGCLNHPRSGLLEPNANSSSSSSSSSSSKRNKVLIVPTLEEVTAYCRERGRGVNPEKWINHYTSNGWMVGKNKMKNWRAAVRNWETESSPKQEELERERERAREALRISNSELTKAG